MILIFPGGFDKLTVGEMLGLGPAALEKRIQRAIRRLKEWPGLDDGGVE